MSHDNLNRLLSKIDSRGRSLSFTWDKAGHMLTKSTYQGSTTSYTYDGAGVLVDITNPDYLTVNYQYDNAGRLLSRVMSSGASSLYTYDNGGWLQSLNHYDATGTLVTSESYTRDRVGNITELNVATGPQVGATRYTLDALYRLTVVNAPAAANSEAFSYDHVGNRLTATRGGTVIGAVGSTTRYYLYTPATNTGSVTGYTPSYDNRLASIDIGSTVGALDSGYTFDNEGRLTSQSGSNTRTMTWDAKGRMHTLNAESYIYDPMDYRIGRSGGTLGSLNYYLEGEHLESVEQASTSMLIEKYFRGSSTDELVAGYVSQNNTLTPYMFQHDQVMSVTAETKPSGGTQASMAYWSFGETLVTSGTPVNRLEYTGRENDGTGLYYYRARYYDPVIGRFISEDPLGFQGSGVNWYAYVGNNPVNGNDPSGNDSLPAAAWGFAIGAGTGAVTSFGIQYFQNHGNINWGNIGWSALTGGVAGALMTTEAGQSMGGLRAIGASTNVVNYLAGTPMSEWSGTGATVAAVSGMAGMMIGGKAPNPYLFLQPSAGLVDKQLIGGMVAPKVLGMGAAGAVAGGVDYMQFIEPTTPQNSTQAPQPTGSVSPGSSFNDGLYGPQNSIGSGAAGGFLIYPNKPNTNQMQSVYAK